MPEEEEEPEGLLESRGFLVPRGLILEPEEPEEEAEVAEEAEEDEEPEPRSVSGPPPPFASECFAPRFILKSDICVPIYKYTQKYIHCLVRVVRSRDRGALALCNEGNIFMILFVALLV